MPNRLLKESICESKGLSEVSFFAEDLYKRLITYADDYGRFNADYQIILARLYPREIGIVSIDDIEDAMTELVGAGKVAFYTSEARKDIYGCFPNWSEHQRVRDSKQKCPEPDDTSVNDWYYRRFISKNMKRRILERDKMKCKECGKFLFADMESAERAIKFGAGLYHIDHIVPVSQGGRATEENLRLLCSSCNLRRKRRFTFEEIIEFSKNPEKYVNQQTDSDVCGNSRKVAATCGDSQKVSENFRLNPIQSNPKKESNPNTNPTRASEAFEKFWTVYPRHENKEAARKAFEEINPDETLLNTMIGTIRKQKDSPQWQEDGGRFIPYPANWLTGKRWEDEVRPRSAGKPVQAQDYEQREYGGTTDDARKRMLAMLDGEIDV